MRQGRFRTAIVTGASRGIGLCIARALAHAGLDVFLAAHPPEGLDEAADELRRQGVRSAALHTDVRSRVELETLFDTAVREFGSIDVLVNNAGVVTARPYHELPIEELDDAMSVNLRGAMILTRLVLPGMLKRGRGHVVNVASLAGKLGPPFGEAYAATKAGLIAFTQSLRAEYRARGVSASALCPGYVEGAGIYQELKDAFGLRVPRWVGGTTADAVARAAVKAIEMDSPEVIINSPPARPLMVLRETSPRLAEWLVRRLNVHAPFREGARIVSSDRR